LKKFSGSKGEEMEETPKQLIFVLVVFSIFIVGFLITNYIPSIIEGTRSPEEIEKSLTFKEKVDREFNSALEEYIKKTNQKPSKFSEFVAYNQSQPEHATLNLEKYSSHFIEKKAVEGVETDTLILRINNPDSNEEEMIVLLLSGDYVSITNF
jgi:hypothetical protein